VAQMIHVCMHMHTYACAETVSTLTGRKPRRKVKVETAESALTAIMGRLLALQPLSMCDGIDPKTSRLRQWDNATASPLLTGGG
jgi:predicted metal-dependent hydrolase